MELLILLKANIKKKKSAFISIALLMMIVTSVLTAILSAVDNYNGGLEKAFETANSGDTVLFIDKEYLTDELKESVENNRLVKSVAYFDTLVASRIACGEKHDGNSEFLQKMRDGIKLFSSDLNRFEDKAPELKAGEVYLPLGMKDKIYCNVGDTVTFDFSGNIDADFKIAGFVQEPSFGAQTIGWKQAFISDEDYDRLNEKLEKSEKNMGEVSSALIMAIYKADSCDFSAGKFQRELNLETGIIDNSHGALTKDQTIRYSTLMPEVLTKLFTVFAAFLFLIVLILISHSISTDIQTDYVTFGILKSQGFSRKKLSHLFFAQYLIAEALGVFLGTFLSIPIESVITNACRLITGTMPNRGISAGKSLLLIGCILLTSAVLIFIKTLPLGKISPVKAISGGKEDIYFDSRIKLPISKKLLSFTIAARQFTSAKRKYLGAVFISVILIFFMLTINLIMNLMTSKNALLAMGTEFADIAVYCSDSACEEYLSEIKNFISERAEIKEIFYSDYTYLSVNGENLMARIVRNPEKITPILKGRAPIYDNEIVITEMIAETIEKNVGDKVKITAKDREAEYIISGLYQTTNDSGMCFAFSENAVNRLFDYKVLNMSIMLSEKDNGRAEEIVEMLEKKYDGDDNVSFGAYNINNYIGAGIIEIIDIMRVLIYVLSAFFALITVKMVCTRALLQERTDIGIYKALGYTVRSLRLGFGFRFLITAVLGTVLGIAVSLLFSSKLLGLGLSLVGLSHLPTEIDFISVIIPSVMLTLCFFVFAYWASGKIKRIKIRELVTE